MEATIQIEAYNWIAISIDQMMRGKKTHLLPEYNIYGVVINATW